MASAIDDLFADLYGDRPAKEREALERLAAAAVHLVGEHDSVFHN